MDWTELISKFGYLILIGIAYVISWLIKTFSNANNEQSEKSVRQRQKAKGRGRMTPSLLQQQGEHSAEDAYGSSQTLNEGLRMQSDRQANDLRNRLPRGIQKDLKRRKQRTAVPKLSQQGLKQAIILKEILDPPLARRQGKRVR